MSRAALLLCPGRGSYTAGELAYLSRPAPERARGRLFDVLEHVDRQRAARGRRGVRDMDAAASFDGELLHADNAPALTFACTAFDALRLDDDALEVVAVAGNSMGWYSALFVGGSLQLDDTFALVETMGAATGDDGAGGQIVYPLVDEQWRVDGERAAAVEDAARGARDAGGRAGWSIHYGGFAVLWADEAGAEAVLEALPRIKDGRRTYPLRLPGHGPFHSPLMEDAARVGRERLSALPVDRPRVPLIDGRGNVWTPLSADPVGLLRYTLHTQVVDTFDFSAAVRVGLREFAPDCIVLLGPGDALGAAVAHVLIAERWQGIDSRAAFAARQQDDPLLISLARPEQAEAVLRSAD